MQSVAVKQVPPHVFVVDDDEVLTTVLNDYFHNQGLSVTTMATAEDLMQQLEGARPDLIVLDISLPGMSGLQACQRLRIDGDAVPIILLTGRGEEVDRIIGLEMGADDYMAKPFSARELLARTRAVLRRSAFKPANDIQAATRIGDFNFVMSTRSLHKGSQVRVLNTVEYALLAELTANPGVPVGRERLLEVSHENAEPVLLRTVDAAIMRLRKLIEPAPSQPQFIKTVRFHGYMFLPRHSSASL